MNDSIKIKPEIGKINKSRTIYKKKNKAVLENIEEKPLAKKHKQIIKIKNRKDGKKTTKILKHKIKAPTFKVADKKLERALKFLEVNKTSRDILKEKCITPIHLEKRSQTHFSDFINLLEEARKCLIRKDWNGLAKILSVAKPISGSDYSMYFAVLLKYASICLSFNPDKELLGIFFQSVLMCATDLDKQDIFKKFMDRTLIDTYRAEEKELSEQIHKKLEFLMFIYPVSSEFRKIFAEGMFLKPNQKAFFYIMHFLLNILDANEFRKRFYWPIVDKRSEGNFRSSVVEYLNYLNKKHNLQWKHQWNYLVQMPGGNKFLMFLVDLADFVTVEIVKQKEKYLENKNWKLNEPFNKSLLMKLKLRNSCFKANVLHYVESLESRTKKYKENSVIIRNRITDISKKCKNPLEELYDEDYVNEYCEFANKILKDNFSIQVENMSKTEQNLLDIKNTIENFESQNTNVKYDAEKLVKTAKQFIPDDNIFVENEINFDVMSNVFIQICPIVDDLLSIYDENSLEILHFQKSELSKLNTEVVRFDGDIKKFVTKVNRDLDNLKSNEVISKTELNKMDMFTNSNLPPKLIFTPPIVNCNEGENQFRRRLPLMDNFSSPSQNEFTFAHNQTTVMLPPSGRKQKDDSKYLNRIQNQNNTKILNASTFLRSLKKQKVNSNLYSNEQQNHSLNQLAKQWKERESSFYEEENITQLELNQLKSENKNKKKVESDVLKLSVTFSETLKLIEAHVPEKKFEKTEFSKRKLFLDIPQKLNKAVKGSPSFLKQDSPLDLEKISTSPSGRLDPLVKFTKNDFANNCSLESDILELASSPKIITEKIDDIDTSMLDISDVKDSLFNISDSILKDIPT